MNTISGNLGPDTERQQEYEMQIPNLAGIATSDLVEQIKSQNSSFSAAYINWARTLNLLRQHAPGWLPEIVPSPDGVVHRAPVGGYLLIRFRNGQEVTPEVPQAVMDQRNAPIPWEKITSRDVTDTHRRGVCMAAAFTFGLAYELWAKLPLESGFHKDGDPKPERMDGLSEDRVQELESMAADMLALVDEDRAMAAVDAYYSLPSNEEKLCLWGFLKGPGGGSTPESRLRALIKANIPADRKTA